MNLDQEIADIRAKIHGMIDTGLLHKDHPDHFLPSVQDGSAFRGPVHHRTKALHDGNVHVVMRQDYRLARFKEFDVSQWYVERVEQGPLPERKTPDLSWTQRGYIRKRIQWLRDNGMLDE